MLNSLVIALLTSSLMLLANFKNYEFKREFEFLAPISLRTLDLMSIYSGTFLGVLSYYGSIISDHQSDAIYFTILGSLIGYIAIYVSYTDFLFLKADRWTLRIGYLIVLVMNIFYTVTQYVSYSQASAITSLFIIYFLLFIIFIFSGVGASDVRAISIILPFLFIVNNTIGLLSFIIAIFYIAIVMVFWHHKVHDRRAPVPILPYLILPYVFIVPLFGLLTDYWTQFNL